MPVLLMVVLLMIVVCATVLVLSGHAIVSAIGRSNARRKDRKALREELRIKELEASERAAERDHEERLASLKAVGIGDEEAARILDETHIEH